MLFNLHLVLKHRRIYYSLVVVMRARMTQIHRKNLWFKGHGTQLLKSTDPVLFFALRIWRVLAARVWFFIFVIFAMFDVIIPSDKLFSSAGKFWRYVNFIPAFFRSWEKSIRPYNEAFKNSYHAGKKYAQTTLRKSLPLNLHGNYQSPCQCHTIATSVCSVCSSGVTVVICFDMTVLVVHDYLKARSDKCNALKQI